MISGEEQRDRYKDYDMLILTDREEQCVKMAKDGMSGADIARKLGVSRQRVKQLLDKATEKQERWEAHERQA